MTREQFLDRHRPVFGGFVADAVSSDKRGADLAIKLRTWLRGIDDELAKIYAELYPPTPDTKPAPSNGVATAPQRKV